jgi:thymidine kinase
MPKIEVIIGPMFSGKSTELLRRARRYSAIGKKIMYINHSLDTRYGDDKISTHDKRETPAIMTPKLMYLLKTEPFNECDIIAINEAQFFTDLVEFCRLSLNEFGKHIIIAGLDGDYKREPFGDILQLIPMAESVIKLSAYCKICTAKASFTKRVTPNLSQIVIGTDDCYIPVCSKHYQ